MFRRTSLQNGLKIVTQNLEGTAAVTVLVLVGAGSRYETHEINGISHFLEHMFFKGAEKYPDAKAVSEAIDSVGGDFNAFTGKEYAGYYVKVDAVHRKVAMAVLSDMMIKSKFAQEEIDKERGVILEEFNMYQDTPMYQVGWDFERLMFGDQPLGWDQVGRKEVIQTVNHEDFVKYKNELYTPDNTVIAVCGKVDHDEVVAEVEKYFQFPNISKSYSWKSFKALKVPKKVFLHHKKTEQAHLVIGFPGYEELHKDHYAEKLLSVILGGNMSSRMFLSVREKQGLTYYIQTSTDNYQDTGAISTRAGIDLKRIDLAITSIIKEYKKIKEEIVPEIELKKAKDYIRGKMVLRLEDSEEYSHLLAKQELLHKKIKTPKEIMEAVDAVTAQDIKRVSDNLFKEENLRLAVIGPYEDGRFDKLLRF